ncbi:dUTP diphosphatase [Blattabacterium cuenoti]|uniref:dUTP diphosphatase n=1 Tax=Blattabacterium cuenoti TaxID=1653831 RepID=UPI00163D2BEE|nr:dUTP diphosphatase [Blattabacterium cuenoti]
MNNILLLKDYFPKNIYNNNLISLNSLDRKLISTGYCISLKTYKKCYFFIKKIFINAFCFIHITKCMEIKIIMINISYEKIFIYPKNKIGIIDFFSKNNITWKYSSTLNYSKRGKKCFGSTGI